jgi:hypothetical protein
MLLRVVSALAALTFMALPGVSLAACGSAKGSVDLTGRTYSGNIAWSPENLYNITVTLKPDCTVTYVIFMGSTRTGRWNQDGPRFTLDVPDIQMHYDGVVGAKGVMTGTIASDGSTGTFRFTLDTPKTAPVVAAPAAGRCGPSAGVDPAGHLFDGQAQFTGAQAFSMAVRLNRDCSFSTLAGGRTYDGGRWSQTGETVTLIMAGGDATYFGTLGGDRSLTGTMKNWSGDPGTFRFKQRD